MSRDAELPGRVAGGLVVGSCLSVSVAVGASVVLTVALHRSGRGDLVLEPGVLAVYAAAVVSSGAVGVVLLRRRRHPVGGAFVVLAAALAVSVAANLYAREGLLTRGGSLPAAEVVAHLVDPSFLLFFVSVAVALHRTPTGRPLTPAWRRVERLTVLVAGITYLSWVVSTDPIDAPFDAVPNPLGLPALGPLTTLVRDVGASATALGLLLSVVSLAVRFRGAGEEQRRQLLWLVLAVLPMPVFLVVVFVYRNSDNGLPQLFATAGFIVVVPVATALSITRYHLFDVDRILSRTLTYLLCTALVVLTYVGVVVGSGRLLSRDAGASPLSAVLGTLVAVSIAAPVRRRLQDALDRRFNRRRYTALAVVHRHLARSDTVDVEALLREALADPDLSIAYRVEDDEGWITREGRVIEPASDCIIARRAGRPIAAVGVGRGSVAPELAEQVVSLVLAELDNTRLQAAIRSRLVEAEQSRTRIATAQLAERRRLERDLHDGAQQRLLALGFELRAAQLNGSVPCLREAVGRGIEQTGAALAELRDLANGLRPAVLADGGLSAALDDLAARTPRPLFVTCTPRRFAPDLEAAAWFVISEAVTNALKHAAPCDVTVQVDAPEDWLTATVTDEGPGGAVLDSGGGLQGMRDRVAAAGGSVDVRSPVGRGTRITARLPCGS